MPVAVGLRSSFQGKTRSGSQRPGSNGRDRGPGRTTAGDGAEGRAPASTDLDAVHRKVSSKKATGQIFVKPIKILPRIGAGGLSLLGKPSRSGSCCNDLV